MFKKIATGMFVIYILTLFQPIHAAAISKLCPYNHYRLVGQDKCILCPSCGVGSGMNTKCNPVNPYKPKDAPRCVPCVAGESFSDYVSSEECIPCSAPCPVEEHETETKKCTRYQDRTCKCKEGYFVSEIDGKCVECCYCGVGGSDRHIKKCIGDKMPYGKYCAPTRDDGKCDARNVTTTTPSPRTTGLTTSAMIPQTTATFSLNTTVRVERNVTSMTSKPEGSSRSTEYLLIGVVVAIVILIALVIALVLGCYFRRRPGTKPPEKCPLQKAEPFSSTDTWRSSIISYKVTPEMLGFPYKHAQLGIEAKPLSSSHTSSSSLNSYKVTPEFPCKSGQFGTAGSHKQPSSDNYASVGPFLKSISVTQRLKLAGMLDKRESGNWWDLGEHIARGYPTLLDDVRKCHQCYYGGGSPCLEMFANIDVTKVELTMVEFMNIAKKLNRYDIDKYIQENGLTNKNFTDIEYYHKVKMADILDRRVENAHGWNSFADELKYTTEDINKFQLKIKEPQDNSPTIKLIDILAQSRPELTIENLQDAAKEIGRKDVQLYLDGVIAEIKI